MVSSYLVCDLCGQFGPPASFLNEEGLRLCYQCWYRERQDNESVVDIDNTKEFSRNSDDNSDKSQIRDTDEN